jgi:holo-[acyl-carrier protein] synthase
MDCRKSSATPQFPGVETCCQRSQDSRSARYKNPRLVSAIVGIDVQSVKEVAASLEVFGSRYTNRIFTNQEIECCDENPLTASSSYAARFAAKEAMLKILDVRESVPSWKAIEVRRTSAGSLEIVLLGLAVELACRQGIEAISLSVSHNNQEAVAVVVAQVRRDQCQEP